MPEWRNWQTRRIQNPVRFTPGVGSTPTFGISSVGIHRTKKRSLPLVLRFYWMASLDEKQLRQRLIEPFMDHSVPRLTGLLKSYTMHQLFVHLVGEPFGDDSDSGLFNALWQEHMIIVPLATGAYFCPRHCATTPLILPSSSRPVGIGIGTGRFTGSPNVPSPGAPGSWRGLRTREFGRNTLNGVVVLKACESLADKQNPFS